MALVLIESTVAERGGTTTSYSNRCCTKARAEALNCTVTAPSGAVSNQLITGIKGNRSGVVSCSNVTYGSTVTATVSGNTESGTVTWGVTAGTGTATISSAGVVTPTKAGTVTITASVAATPNYNDYIAEPKQITINQRTVTITAPTATNRTYTGSAQTIFAAGSCTTGGTMYYSDTNKAFSTSTWSTTVPTPKQTTAGTYTLYYYCSVDTTNNTGTNINTILSVQATISKKATAAPVLTAGGTTTYTGTTYYAKAASVSGNPAGRIYYGSSSGSTDHYITVTASSTTAANLTAMGRADVGTTTIYAFFRPTDTTNYADSSSASTTVKITNRATGSVTVTGKALDSTGSAQALVSVSNQKTGTMHYRVGTSGSWGTSIPKATAAGTYTVYYYSEASTNYTAVGSSSSPKSVTSTIGVYMIEGPDSITLKGTVNSGLYEFISSKSGAWSPVTVSCGSHLSASARQLSGTNGEVTFSWSGASGTDSITLTQTASGKTLTTTVIKN